MATLTMTFERLTSILRPQTTFWSELSPEDRQSSVNKAVHRPLGDKTAWDAAGLISQYWIDEICPVVQEYRRTHSKYILKGEDWTGPVNCFMVGMTWMTSVPTVVITSLNKGIYGRFGNLLRKDDRFRRSGFSILGQRGCLRLKMERSKGSPDLWDPALDGLQHLYGETIVIPYSSSAKAYAKAAQREDLLRMQDRTSTATMGGVIVIGEQWFGLTVAHPFVDPKRNVPTENTSVVSVGSPIDLQRKASEYISLGTTETAEVFGSGILDIYDEDGDPAELADQPDPPAVHIDEDLAARPIFLGAALDLVRETMSKSAVHPSQDYADMQIGIFPGSTIATKGELSAEGERRKHADLGLDWALIDLLVDKPIDGCNTLVADNLVIRTSSVAKGPPVGDVLIVCKASQYPRSTCSGTVALISMPGSGRLQKVYTLKRPEVTAEHAVKSHSGESGSFVIDRSTGDAYGVVVAESLDLELTYMMPLDAIFEDITSKWGGNLVHFPKAQKEDPDTLMSMNNLANMLSRQSKYMQAEEMHRQALRLSETMLGKEHPDTLTSMNNLALVLRNQGKYEQAEEMLRRALRLMKTALGKEYPDTLTSMGNLATVLSDQGKYEQAEEMHRQVLGLSETVLGKEHPPKPTPKSSVKALPTVRDHTSDQLDPEGDEYIPREFDEAGEKKVNALGYPQDGRQYRCRTFTVPGRGKKLFMLAIECARVLTYRDSYLLFNKNRSLYKIIATQKEKEDLIEQEILPLSYRSRQIAIVTARSMFRQFGSRVIVGGRRVRDDYWESKARKQGFTEEDPAGEKRPGASRAREAAVAEGHTFAHGHVVYSSGPGFDGMQPPDLHLGLAATMAPLPMINIADDHRFRDIARPRQDITGPPYQDRTQSSTESEIVNQAAHTADFSKAHNRKRSFRSSMLEEYWNRPHEPPASSPQSQAVDAAATAVKQSSSPRFGSVDITSSSSQLALWPQQMNPPPYPHQQNPMQSPLRQPSMQSNSLRDPSYHPQQPHLARSSSGLSMSQSQPQSSPYGSYQQHNPLHPSQQLWGGPPQPQQSPVLNWMHTPHFSPSMGHPQVGQVASPVPGQHQPSPSPHPPQSMQPPQMLHHQSSTGIHTVEHEQPGDGAEGSGQVRAGGRDASTSTPAV